MSIEIRLPTLLRAAAEGSPSVFVEGATVGAALRAMVESYPGMKDQVLTSDGELHRFVNVYVNDDDVRYLDRLDTKLGEGDAISILPAVAGGSS